MNLRIRWLFGLVVVVSSLLVSSAVFAGHTWNGYHWPSYNLNPGVVDNTAYGSEVGDAVEAWNNLGSDLQLNGGGSDIEVRAKNASALYLGVAEIQVDADGHILSGRVTINHRYLKDGNLYGYDAGDRIHVICQEVGHILGLDHQDGESCMNDDNATLGNYTAPNSHDGETLEEIYDGHVDEEPADPPSGNDKGGPPCSKNPSHPNCVGQGAVWITIDVIPAPQP